MSADSTWCGINISFPAFLPTTPRTKQHQQCTTYAATPHTTEAPLDRETVADREKESSLDPARRLSKTLTLERGGRRFHQHIARRRRPQRPPPPMHHGKMLTFVLRSQIANPVLSTVTVTQHHLLTMILHPRAIVVFLIVATAVNQANAFAPSPRSAAGGSKHLTRVNIATPLPNLGDMISLGGGNSNNDNDGQKEPMRTGATLIDLDGIAFSGLKGKALTLTKDDFPDSGTVRKVIPADCFEPETAKSLGYLSVSVVGTALCTYFGVSALSVLDPANILTLPFWLAYSVVTGTVAMGLWVLAHECGHGAFSKDKKLQDAVGYVLHSLFLVPYYSWQRSHAVHHRYTNHMELGETHVPEDSAIDAKDKLYDSIELRKNILNQFGDEDGIKIWGAFQAFLHLIIGWPAYLLIGATGGPDRGMTNHYFPYPLSEPKQPKKELFPGNWKEKVYQSDIGVAFVTASALAWAACNGVPEMMALYGGPLIVVNAWLVLYTW